MKIRKNGVASFKSHKVTVAASSEVVFNFLRNLNNFGKMMPEQVINWQSTENDCEFDIKGMAHISLFKSEEVPGKSVLIISKPGNPIELKITGNVESLGPYSTSSWIGLSAKLSPILKLMASAPLQNLVNIMADKLTSVEF